MRYLYLVIDNINQTKESDNIILTEYFITNFALFNDDTNSEHNKCTAIFKKTQSIWKKWPMQSLNRCFEDQHYAVCMQKGKNGFIHTKMEKTHQLYLVFSY